MNVEKVVAALRQTDQLVCGGLVYAGGRCAVGQLFFAAGKTDSEITEEEQDISGYENMFDGLLGREYDIGIQDIDAIWQANDSGETVNIKEENCQRRNRMVEWAQNYEVTS